MKHRLRGLSLKNKLIAIILLTSGIVLLCVTVAILFYEGVATHREGREKLEVLADVIGRNISAPILFDDQEAAAETLAALSANTHITDAYVIARDGRPFAEYHRSKGKEQRRSWKEANGSLWGSAFRQEVTKSITSEGKAIGAVVIMSDMLDLVWHLAWFLSLFTAIALVLFFVAFYLSSRLQGLISTPIMELAGTMKRITSERDYGIRPRKAYDDEIGALIDGFNEMLSQIELREEKLAHLAHFDSLTSLPNRRLFQDRLSQATHLALRTGKEVAVLFIDLDNFKDVNDTYGHRIGDLLLKDVAERLATQVRKCDTLARLGGDEFVVILQNVEKTANVIRAAEKLTQSLSPHFNLEGIEIFITASIGISFFPGDGDSVEELIRNADAAMYHAKKLGKNCFEFFSQHMHDGASRRLNMVKSLHRALEQDEFVLHYQPKVDIATGNIVGAEALLRWHDQEHGIVPPHHFIPLAEESGLIIPIGEWVIRMVCHQMKEWVAIGIPLFPVAVNVSAFQFRSQQIAPTIAKILGEAGIDPSYLEVELTESAVMHNVDEAMETLRALKGKGIQVAIDDFGTGYSSLANLKRFSIDCIKIDRSFIKNIPDNRDDKAIVTAIIAMAQSLNLKVIAEGVETEAQLSFLKSHGCHEYQGYLCSKPVHADEFVAYLLSSHIFSPLSTGTADACPQHPIPCP